ncbi:hypothetical protein AB0G32_00685 [Streptomyces sp. NPDC023723]|uniref:hypothetical protein n=1 Tax=Streptomyces sp. NPDC023723 TaxID=3154323 RepID=UPI0033FE081D
MTAVPAGGARRAPATALAAATGSRAALGSRRMLDIQRLAGNAAVSRLVSGRPSAEESHELTELPPERTAVTERAAPAGKEVDALAGHYLGMAPRDPAGDPGSTAPPSAAYPPVTLPPYLMDMTTSGHSTVFALPEEDIAAVVRVIRGTDLRGAPSNRQDIDASVVAARLRSEPDTFFGRGRTFALAGKKKRVFDVTVALGPAPKDAPYPALFPNPALPAGTGSGLTAQQEALAAAHIDKEVKDDNQLAATGGHNAGSHRTASPGFNPSAKAYGTPDGLNYLGGHFGAGGAFHSERSRHSGRAVTEARTLRSAPLSVRVKRQVRYSVRIKQQDAPEPVVGSHLGGLEMRVPMEYMVPAGTARPAFAKDLSDTQKAEVGKAVSLSTIGVEDTGDPHEGGDGLFDKVAGATHGRMTAPGTPGRAQLYAEVSRETIHRELPRLLAGWVTSDVLQSDQKHRESRGVFRMRAEILRMTPLVAPPKPGAAGGDGGTAPDPGGTGKAPNAWDEEIMGGTPGGPEESRPSPAQLVGAGPDQARHHQTVASTQGVAAATGSSGGVEGGFAYILGVPGAAALRANLVGSAGAKNMGSSSLDRTTTVRQGAEVRGPKVLFRSTVRLFIEYGGPRDGDQITGAKHRDAQHDIEAWMSLRKEEAYHVLGDHLPEDTSVRPLYDKRKRTADGTVLKNADGTDQLHDRHLQFDGMGNSTTLTHLDTGALIAYLEQTFADPKSGLRGEYLPEFGGGAEPFFMDPRKGDGDRLLTNLRTLHEELSPARLAVQKSRLLTSGVLVRLRSKTDLKSRDVEIRVHGTIGDIVYEGDTENWLNRNSAGAGWSAGSGKQSSRQGNVRAEIQATEGHVGLQTSANAGWADSRGVQGGPVGRTDSLNAGSTTTSTFGTELRLSVDVVRTTRGRTLERSFRPGAPGRDMPEDEPLFSSDADNEITGLTNQKGKQPRVYAFAGAAQQVKLSTPAEFTADSAGQRVTAGTPEEPRALGKGAPASISALATMGSGGSGVRDWEYIETVGSGEPLSELAFQLLARAAAKADEGDGDKVFEASGLAPKLALKEHYSPEDIRSDLREGVDAHRVVSGLRYPRRIKTLEGAVGDHFELTLASPQPLREVLGVGMENMALGGHQASAMKARTTTRGTAAGVTGTERGDGFRVREGLTGVQGTGETTSRADATGATVERNAVHPRAREPLFLVQCHLTTTMIAEVKPGHGSDPVTRGGSRTLPRQVALWLTADQLAKAGMGPNALKVWRQKEAEKTRAKEKAALDEHRKHLERQDAEERAKEEAEHNDRRRQEESGHRGAERAERGKATAALGDAKDRHARSEALRVGERDQLRADDQHWADELREEDERQADTDRQEALRRRIERLRLQQRELTQRRADRTEQWVLQQDLDALTGELAELEAEQRRREQRERRRRNRLAKKRARTGQPRKRPPGKARKRQARLEQERADQDTVRAEQATADASRQEHEGVVLQHEQEADARSAQQRLEFEEADRERQELETDRQARRGAQRRSRLERRRQVKARHSEDRTAEGQEREALRQQERDRRDEARQERAGRDERRAEELKRIRARKPQQEEFEKKETERKDKAADDETKWQEQLTDHRTKMDAALAAPGGKGTPEVATTFAQDLPLGFGLIEDAPDFLPLKDLLRAELARRNKSLCDDLLPESEIEDKYKNTQALTKLLGRDGAMGVLASAMDGGAVIQLRRNTRTPFLRGNVYWLELRVERTGDGNVTGLAGKDREIEYATVGFHQHTQSVKESTSRGAQLPLSGSGSTGDAVIESAGGASGFRFDTAHSRQRATADREQVGVRAIMGDTGAFQSRVRVPVDVKLVLRSNSGPVLEVPLRGPQALVYRALQNDLNALAKMKRPEPDAKAPAAVRRTGAGQGAQSPRAWRKEGVGLPWAVVVNGFVGAPQVVDTVRGAVRDAAKKRSDVLAGADEAAYGLREAVSTEWLITWLPQIVSAGVPLPPQHLSGPEGSDADCELHGRLKDGVILGDSEKMTFEPVAQALLTSGSVDGNDTVDGSAVQAPRAAGNAYSTSASHSRSGVPPFGSGPARDGTDGLNGAGTTTGMPGGDMASSGNTSGMVPLQKPKDDTVLVRFALDVRAVARLRHRHTQWLRGAEAVGDLEKRLSHPVVIRLHKKDVEAMVKDGRLKKETT